MMPRLSLACVSMFPPGPSQRHQWLGRRRIGPQEVRPGPTSVQRTWRPSSRRSSIVTAGRRSTTWFSSFPALARERQKPSREKTRRGFTLSGCRVATEWFSTIRRISIRLRTKSASWLLRARWSVSPPRRPIRMPVIPSPTASTMSASSSTLMASSRARISARLTLKASRR